ncbi:hypothetical protein DW701_17450 [Bacteroides eggerthii]|jgi:hypothetical protein|uniref:Uncharacterized protein n=1 Tax=Bacteroides eggerthii TaxID=28111 RepID=A0A414M1K5_9BACE|nr:hypothetical protein [Bacteroides eggerthii]RHF02010.1 hypothetical protein DW701_17450 [Bacteroides eggerthii]
MKTNKLCGKCRQPVEKETKLDYPYYCPHCDENLYEFETVQEATRKVIRREIYSAEEAAHSVELYAFMQENGFCDVYDFSQSDPDILRIKNSEVSFTEVDINENTTFVIYNDSEYQATESEIKPCYSVFIPTISSTILRNRIAVGQCSGVWLMALPIEAEKATIMRYGNTRTN